MRARVTLWSGEELREQMGLREVVMEPVRRSPVQVRLPADLQVTGNICPRCATAVLMGERDEAGRWRCRGCRTYQDEPRVVPVIAGR